jgi:hypothetical protein
MSERCYRHDYGLSCEYCVASEIIHVNKKKKKTRERGITMNTEQKLQKIHFDIWFGFIITWLLVMLLFIYSQ